MKPSPVQLDGTLYVSWAMLTFMQGVFSSEESYKYVNPFLLFWLKAVCGAIAAGAGALKIFRSTSYTGSKP